MNKNAHSQRLSRFEMLCSEWKTHPTHVISDAAKDAYRRCDITQNSVDAPLSDYIRICHSLGFYFAPRAPSHAANVLGMLMVWFFVVDDPIDEGFLHDI